MRKKLIPIALFLALSTMTGNTCEGGLLHDGDELNQGVMYEVSQTIADYHLEQEKQADRRAKLSELYKDVIDGKYEPKHEDTCCDGCSIPCDNLGTFTAYAYCGCYDCNGEWTGCRTASGTIPKSGRTIAVDSSVIPLGSHIYVEFADGGIREYVAEDTGNFSGKVLDVFCSSHEECERFGKQEVKVYLVKE